MTPAEACQREVLGLHQFFEDWFAGRIEATDANFERCTAALAPEFTLINPDGEWTSRGDLLQRLLAAHGHAADTYFHIRIQDVATRALEDGLYLTTYQEWQETDGFVTARWSSALLRAAADSAAGVRWLHVQETWIATDDLEDGREGASAESTSA